METSNEIPKNDRFKLINQSTVDEFDLFIDNESDEFVKTRNLEGLRQLIGLLKQGVLYIEEKIEDVVLSSYDQKTHIIRIVLQELTDVVMIHASNDTKTVKIETFDPDIPEALNIIRKRIRNEVMDNPYTFMDDIWTNPNSTIITWRWLI